MLIIIVFIFDFITTRRKFDFLCVELNYFSEEFIKLFSFKIRLNSLFLFSDKKLIEKPYDKI